MRSGPEEAPLPPAPPSGAAASSCVCPEKEKLGFRLQKISGKSMSASYFPKPRTSQPLITYPLWRMRGFPLFPSGFERGNLDGFPSGPVSRGRGFPGQRSVAWFVSSAPRDRAETRGAGGARGGRGCTVEWRQKEVLFRQKPQWSHSDPARRLGRAALAGELVHRVEAPELISRDGQKTADSAVSPLGVVVIRCRAPSGDSGESTGVGSVARGEMGRVPVGPVYWDPWQCCPGSLGGRGAGGGSTE